MGWCRLVGIYGTAIDSWRNKKNFKVKYGRIVSMPTLTAMYLAKISGNIRKKDQNPRFPTILFDLKWLIEI